MTNLPGDTSHSLHTVWAQNNSPVQFSPLFDALLHTLRARFRVATVMLFMVRDGAAVLNMHAGTDPAGLDCEAALALCQGQADQLHVIEDTATPEGEPLELKKASPDSQRYQRWCLGLGHGNR